MTKHKIPVDAPSSEIEKEFDRVRSRVDERRRELDSDFDRRAAEMRSDADRPRPAREEEMEETDKGYRIRIRAEGLDPKQIDVRAEGRSLSVEADSEKKEERTEGNRRISETTRIRLSRRFSFPEDVDGDRIQANYRNDVLEIAVPRTKTSR